MKKIIQNNDIYFINMVEDMIITNDNYQGLDIYNFTLRKINNIKTFEGMIIYSSFSYKKEMILYCPDNNCFLYVNLENSKIMKMMIPEKSGVFIDCIWDEQKILLLDNYNNSYEMDSITGTIIPNYQLIQKNEISDSIELKVLKDKVEILLNDKYYVFNVINGFNYLTAKVLQQKETNVILLSEKEGDITNSAIEIYCLD